MERSLVQERRREGIALAKTGSVHQGWARRLDEAAAGTGAYASAPSLADVASERG